MENISQMSLLEVAILLMEQKKNKQSIKALIKEVLDGVKVLGQGELNKKLTVKVEFPGITVKKGEGEWTEGQFPDNVYLACSGTEKVETVSNNDVENEGVKVIDAVKQLIDLAQKSYVVDDEGNKRFK